jgi:hypothetical protein
MPLIPHLSIHLTLSLFASFLVWLFFEKHLSGIILGALLGGFLIDFDHFIDYFLAFGLNFKLSYFTRGYEFLKSDKIYILFHGWEYVILLVALALVLKNKTIRTIGATGAFIFAIALGAFFHLGADIVLNEGMTVKSYSIIFRAKNNFQMEKIVTPEHWQNHIKKKTRVDF